MDKERVLEQEAVNDGQSVFLFFDDDEGCYKAFGRSAYYADMVVDARMYYSEEMDLPVMELGKQAVMDLRLNMTKMEHRAHEFYRFKTKVKIGDVGYERWKEGLVRG